MHFSMDSKEHRRQLLDILNKISNGEIDSKNVQLDKLFMNYLGARKQYASPEDRNSYNYGYMTLPEVTVN